jgi:hypothetical protein
MKHSAVIFTLCLLLSTGAVYAQKTTGATRFSSAYTNLDRDCKTIRGGEGTDDASDCKGVGGYRVQVWAAAAAQMIAVESPGKKDRFQIAAQNFDFNQTKIKVEWRTANGKPFAVIMRIFKYSDEKADDSAYFGKKIGEELRIVGLKGFENIDFTVDAKTPDANLKARELADNAYAAKK